MTGPDEDEDPQVMEQLRDHAAERYPEMAGKTVPAGMLLAYLDLFHQPSPEDERDVVYGPTAALQHAIRSLASS